MLDILVNDYLVIEDTTTYLTFSAETALAAFIFHAQWNVLLIGLWYSFDYARDKIN